MTIDWSALFVPRESLLELVIRGTVMYLGILIATRLFRRASGSLSVADLLLVVLIADAAQNGMSGEYRSVTAGLVLVGTIIGWSYALDWLGYHVEFIGRFLQPPPVLLIRDGRINHAQLRREMISMSELREHLREHGVELKDVRRGYLEGDGKISVLKRDGGDSDEQDEGTPGAGTR